MKKRTRKTRTRQAWSQMVLRRERVIEELEKQIKSLHGDSQIDKAVIARRSKLLCELGEENKRLVEQYEAVVAMNDTQRGTIHGLKKTVEEQTHIIETLRWELREYEEAGTLAYKKKLHELVRLMKDVLDNPMPEESPEPPQQLEIPKHVWRETTVKCFTCQKPIECLLPMDATQPDGNEPVRCLRCEREGTFKKDTSGELFPHWTGEI